MSPLPHGGTANLPGRAGDAVRPIWTPTRSSVSKCCGAFQRVWQARRCQFAGISALRRLIATVRVPGGPGLPSCPATTAACPALHIAACLQRGGGGAAQRAPSGVGSADPQMGKLAQRREVGAKGRQVFFKVPAVPAAVRTVHDSCGTVGRQVRPNGPCSAVAFPTACNPGRRATLRAPPIRRPAALPRGRYGLAPPLPCRFGARARRAQGTLRAANLACRARKLTSIINNEVAYIANHCELINIYVHLLRLRAIENVFFVRPAP